MERERAYLDHAATSPMRRGAFEEMVRTARRDFANPASLHPPGKRCRDLLEEARERLLAAVMRGAYPETETVGGSAMGPESGAAGFDLVFTSGGTESDVMALAGAVMGRRAGRVVTSSIEHAAVLECERLLRRLGAKLVKVPPAKSGRVETERLLAELGEGAVAVSLMAVNNETGVVQPVQEVAREVKRRYPRVLVHCDAAQALGNVSLAPGLESVDLVSLSAHKIGGPRGCGALLVRRGLSLEPLLPGGGQEGGRRSGTQNLPGVRGFMAAAEELAEGLAGRISYMDELRRTLREFIHRAAQERRWALRINEVEGEQSPHILSVSVEGVPSEALTRALGASGVDVSHGSACGARRQKQSHVMAAMGIPGGWGTVRFSFSEETSREAVSRGAQAWVDAVDDLRV